jgi:hypothetical protein
MNSSNELRSFRPSTSRLIDRESDDEGISRRRFFNNPNRVYDQPYGTSPQEREMLLKLRDISQGGVWGNTAHLFERIFSMIENLRRLISLMLDLYDVERSRAQLTFYRQP